MALVRVTPEALAQWLRFRVIRERIGRLFERLEAWPAVSGAKPLSGHLAGRFRLRTGDFRLRLCVRGKIILVEKIGHRSEFYAD